jgi:hypothetical protein
MQENSTSSYNFYLILWNITYILTQKTAKERNIELETFLHIL